VDAEIPGVDFSAASWRGPIFRDVIWRAQIAGDDFSNAALVKSNLDYSDLAAASLVGINLGQASLAEAMSTQALRARIS
jgi:uncharacterized protein YjbI with pentapeptide repeats